jgi:hypothetical protein
MQSDGINSKKEGEKNSKRRIQLIKEKTNGEKKSFKLTGFQL